MEISKHLREMALKITTKEQFFWKAYAKAFEVISNFLTKLIYFQIIPQQLCLNAGIDAIDMLSKLRKAHAVGQKWAGVDIQSEDVEDNMERCVWEPTLVKEVSFINVNYSLLLLPALELTRQAQEIFFQLFRNIN